MNADPYLGRRAAPRLVLAFFMALGALSFAGGRLAAQVDDTAAEPAADLAPNPVPLIEPYTDALADEAAGIDRHVPPGGGPIIIIIDPRWPFPVNPFLRHCPHPCPRLIRFSCGDPADQFLPGFPPALPTPGAPAPGPTATLIPVPSPTPGGAAAGQTYRVCPQMVPAIPQSVQDVALAEPWRVHGFGEKQNPNIPFHPLWNPYRTWLSLRDRNQPYSICNLPVWRAGCP